MNIMAFFIGAATTFFAVNAYIQLRGRGVTHSRLQTILGWILAYWAFSNMKDIVQTLPGLYTQRTLDTILMIDGWSAITFACFLFELTMPGWNNHKRMALLASPFFLFTIAYAATVSHTVVVGYSAFLCMFGITVLLWGGKKSPDIQNTSKTIIPT